MCSRLPLHKNDDEILAKILLIGRSYAAAIERRRSKKNGQSNSQFYLEHVAPSIRKSSIDLWLAKARKVRPGTSSASTVAVEVHGKLTQLFNEITEHENRSLASKYLHFHVPKLFYIYDSRAVEAMRLLSPIIPRASRSKGIGDNEYRKFVEKCDFIVRHCADTFGVALQPRQLDNLLLSLSPA